MDGLFSLGGETTDEVARRYEGQRLHGGTEAVALQNELAWRCYQRSLKTAAPLVIEGVLYSLMDDDLCRAVVGKPKQRHVRPRKQADETSAKVWSGGSNHETPPKPHFGNNQCSSACG